MFNDKASRQHGMGENLSREWNDESHSSELLDALETMSKDCKSGLEKLNELVKLGSALSLFYLGGVYKFGRYGLVIDSAKAKQYWQKAANMGSIEAAFSLAREWELEGEYKLAEKEYKRLAEIGFSPAKYVLGLHHYKGDWVQKDIKKSILLFEQAEKLGHFPSKHWLAHIYGTEKFGVSYKIRGWLKRINMMIPFALYKVNYPNSDRLRT